jgi:hypothetical protein
METEDSNQKKQKRTIASVATSVLSIFDVFSVSPTFYLHGKDKTVSWVGCLTTLLLFASMLGITIFYNIEFINRKNMNIVSL